ncbi:unnamed protein product [Sympodiomycopsis kandeliae]
MSSAVLRSHPVLAVPTRLVSIPSRAFSIGVSKPLCYLDHPPAKNPDQRGLTFLKLDRPEAKNAINTQMLDELSEAIESLKTDDRTRTLIVQSLVPGAFCAGADLKERKNMSMEQFHDWHVKLGKTFRELEKLPFPTIAAVDGVALGGGLELALVTDIRVAGPRATHLGLPETRHAIIPGAGGTQRLTRLIGPSQAKYHILTGKVFDAEYAFTKGIVDVLADPGAGEGEFNQAALMGSLSIAEELGRRGPLALRAAKAAIDEGLYQNLDDGLAVERKHYETLFKTRDRREGLEAFGEKRSPIYEGR